MWGIWFHLLLRKLLDLNIFKSYFWGCNICLLFILFRSESINEDEETTYHSLLQKAGKETSPLGTGADFVSGCNLPCHSDVHDSFFSNLRIQVSHRACFIFFKDFVLMQDTFFSAMLFFWCLCNYLIFLLWIIRYCGLFSFSSSNHWRNWF